MSNERIARFVSDSRLPRLTVNHSSTGKRLTNHKNIRGPDNHDLIPHLSSSVLHSAGPLTIIQASPNSCGASPIARRIEQFLAHDDVLTAPFLKSIVLVLAGIADDDSEKHCADARRELESPAWQALKHRWSINSAKVCSASSKHIVQGPFLVDSTHRCLVEPWRVHADVNNAFKLSIWPSQLQDQHAARTGHARFENTYLAGKATQSLGIAVPSRLYFPKDPRKPLNGLRFAVKDIVHVKGVATSCCSRAYSTLYSEPEPETCSSVIQLIELGAQIVGKTHLSTFALKEEPSECIDFPAPFNPRGDGYQTPGGSSSGSGAAVASYAWLDAAIGTDTTGSGRRPALYNGCFSIRPTPGLLAQDGVVLTMPKFDMLMYFTRDINLMTHIAHHWYKRPCNPPQPKAPRRVVLLCPSDFLDIDNTAQRQVIDHFVDSMSETMQAEVVQFSIEELWRKTAPVWEKDITRYLANVVAHGFYHDTYAYFTQFRRDCKQKLGREPFMSGTNQLWWSIGRLVSDEQNRTAKHRFDVYRRWFIDTVLKPDVQDARVILPIEKLEPSYRDAMAPVPTEFPQGINTLFLSPTLGAPEIAVPAGEISYHSRVTKQVEVMPVTVSVMAAPEHDHILLEWVQEFLSRSGRRPTVTTGRTMYGAEQPLDQETMHKALGDASHAADASHDADIVSLKAPHHRSPAVITALCYCLQHVSVERIHYERPSLTARLDAALLPSNTERSGRVILENLEASARLPRLHDLRCATSLASTV